MYDNKINIVVRNTRFIYEKDVVQFVLFHCALRRRHNNEYFRLLLNFFTPPIRERRIHNVQLRRERESISGR